MLYINQMTHLKSWAREVILTDAPIVLFGAEQPVKKDQRSMTWFGLLRLM